MIIGIDSKSIKRLHLKDCEDIKVVCPNCGHTTKLSSDNIAGYLEYKGEGDVLYMECYKCEKEFPAIQIKEVTIKIELL